MTKKRDVTGDMTRDVTRNVTGDMTGDVTRNYAWLGARLRGGVAPGGGDVGARDFARFRAISRFSGRDLIRFFSARGHSGPPCERTWAGRRNRERYDGDDMIIVIVIIIIIIIIIIK